MPFLLFQAVAMQVRFFKLGAPNRGERVSKLNRLIQIELELEQSSKLAAQVTNDMIYSDL